MVTSERIRPLSQSLADQIAAGEVVERPASVVKELVENAVDAGASRVDVELEGAGMDMIRVVDDGGGMHPDDVPLALLRHATSKIQRQDQLREIETLGFRGEALASIAAVATVRVRSRRPGDSVGTQIISRPGQPTERMEVGMPVGTQVEVEGLFASVPARRKFVRSEATELGHAMDVIVRVAAVEPGVALRLSHGKRRLLSFASADEEGRVHQLLDRRGRGPYASFERITSDVRVRGWLGHPDHASRQRRGPMFIVRRRVIQDRNLGQILRAAFEGLTPAGATPVACIFVDPPPGAVDVNVHPQKSEVRFAAPQDVYAAVRAAIDGAIEGAGWRQRRIEPQLAARVEAGTQLNIDSASNVGSRAGRVMDAAAAWSQRTHDQDARPPTGSAGNGYRGSRGGPNRSYRLGTRHGHRVEEVPSDEEAMAREQRGIHRTNDGRHDTDLINPEKDEFVEDTTGGAASTPSEHSPSLLGFLGNETALFRWVDALWVADMRGVRAELVRRRLVTELGAGGAAVQRLIRPVVVERDRGHVRTLHDARAGLMELGLELEAFGEETVIVRGVPASWEGGIDDGAMAVLLERVHAWSQLWLDAKRRGTASDVQGAAADAIDALSRAAPVDTRALERLARRWMSELVAQADRWPLEELDALRRWTAPALLGRPPGSK